MSTIKNIIFDLGGVLLQIDYQKTEDAFVNFGISNFANFYKQDYVSELFDEFETGKISANIFYEEFRKITKSNLSNHQIDSAWNAMLLPFWQDRLAWLDIVAKQCNIFLLSNTNEIHYTEVMNIYNRNNPQKTLSSYFIKDYYSHILGLRKPTEMCYLKVLKEQHLQAGETLFVDDTFKNILGAKKAGLNVLHLLPNMDLIEEVNKLLF